MYIVYSFNFSLVIVLSYLQMSDENLFLFYLRSRCIRVLNCSRKCYSKLSKELKIWR